MATVSWPTCTKMSSTGSTGGTYSGISVRSWYDVTVNTSSCTATTYSVTVKMGGAYNTTEYCSIGSVSFNLSVSPTTNLKSTTGTTSGTWSFKNNNSSSNTSSTNKSQATSVTYVFNRTTASQSITVTAYIQKTSSGTTVPKLTASAASITVPALDVINITYNANGGVIADSPHLNGSNYYKLNNSIVQVSSSATGTYSNVVNSYYYGNNAINLTNVGTFNITRTGYYINGLQAYGSTAAGGTLYDQDSSVSGHTGLTFAGLGGSNGSNHTSQTVTNKTLYVHWIPNTYTLTINPNGGVWNNSSSTTSITQNYASTYSVLPPVRPGYTFVGWAETGPGSLAKHNNGDPSLDTSSGGIYVYNNSSNGMVTHTLQTSSAGTEYGSREILISVANGETAPGLGGFYDLTNSAASKKFVHTFVAKIPVGYSVNNAQNATGDGRVITWLTSTEGTGNYEIYAYEHDCGATGTFGTFGHVYIVDGEKPMSWQLAYSAVTDITNGFTDTYTFGAGNGTLTALWIVNDYTLTFNADGGTVSPATKTVTYGTTYNDLPTPTKPGYKFRGWACKDFNGVSGYISFGTNYKFEDKFSFHCSAYMEDWSTCDGRIVACTESGGWNIESTVVEPGGPIRFGAYDSGVGYIVDNISSKSYSDLSSGWHDFDIVFDGTNFRGYIDGNLEVSVPITSGLIGYHSTNSILVGAESGPLDVPAETHYFDGYIGNIIITNTNSLYPSNTYNTFTTPTRDLTLYAIWEKAPIYVKVNGVWVDGTPYVKIGGVWKEVEETFVKVNGAWISGGY